MNSVLIVDDHPLIREGLRSKIERENGLVVCGEAEDGEEALNRLETAEPDVAIVDISLPGISGLELIKHMQALKPEMVVLVLSRHDEELYARRAIRAGARGYVMKRKAGEAIIKAIHQVLAGGIYVSRKINQEMLESIGSHGHNHPTDSPIKRLSDRELEVFELMGRGLGSSDIADQMSISVKTVQSYRSRIKDKLHVDNANELMRRAFHWVEGKEVT